MFKKLGELIYDREVEPRERILRLCIMVAAVLAVLGFVESMFLVGFSNTFLPLGLLIVGLAVATVVTFRFRKVTIVVNVVAIGLIMVVFPEMFLMNGGVDSGASVWFVLGIFYLFMMYTGKQRVFLLIVAIVMYTATYLCGYYYPEYLIPMESRKEAYADSLFAVFSVGISLGVICRFQMSIFEQERKINQEQQDELKKVNNSQNSFFAGMSHEIRTPINTIIGLNEMILRQNPDGKTKEYAANIQVAGRMLLSLVNDILDLSRMEMKRMEVLPEKYDTRAMFQDLVDMIQVRAIEKNLKFYVDIEPNLPSKLYGDERRIKQVLLNILTNAVKYTREGSVTLEVTGESTESEREILKITVSDTGIGIRKENLQYLYDVFKRFDEKRNNQIEGTGLGLAISKQLLDLMGGEISVDSIYTKGTTFTITIPQQIVDNVPIGDGSFLEHSHFTNQEIYRQSFEAPEAKILVVDDNEMNALVVTSLLAATKVNVEIARSGAECLEKTRRQYYNIILMDYLMPEMNGAETLQHLREQTNGLCRDSAVIVLTADTVSEAKQLCQDYDFDGYLEKPIQGIKLEEEILSFLPEDIVEYRKEKIEIPEPGKTVAANRGHKKKRICVTTDCISDIPESLTNEYGIKMMYLYIKTDKARFADTREISADNLSDFYDEKGNITAFADSTSVEEYEAFFADVLTGAEDVIHIAMTSRIGKSYNVAVEAAKSFDHVHIIDSEQISCGEGLVTLYAAKLAMEGARTGEICYKVDRMKKLVSTRFIMPSAAELCRNGYVGARINQLCNVLKLHPIMEIRRGKLVLQGVGIGDLEKWWRLFIRRHIFPRKTIDTRVVSIAHAGCSAHQQEILKQEVSRKLQFDKILVQKTSFSNACNAGIGTIGISYYRKGI